MPSAWNMFVKKIYEEGKAKDPNYEFKNALKDASKRKSEMGHSSSHSSKKHHHSRRHRSARRHRHHAKKTRRHRRHH